jgi:hypothetical protein
MSKYIRIRWPRGGVEWIDSPLTPDPQGDEIRQTTEFWPTLGWVDYATTSRRCKNPDGSQQITIHYSKENNSNLLSKPDLLREWGAPDTWDWGTMIITFSSDLNSAEAEWKSDPLDIEYDAKVQCTVLSKELYANTEQEWVSRRKREQAKFKNLLRDAGDNCCAITGETTQTVLDAAHIIDKSENGAESISNGILLRADIHRLYDARRFKIGQDGSIIDISGEISEKYKGVLNNKKVDERIISRIREALAKRARLRQGG